jgi:hypothetical protein
MSNRSNIFTQSYISNLMHLPRLLLKITTIPRKINTAQRLYIFFIQSTLSGVKRRFAL